MSDEENKGAADAPKPSAAQPTPSKKTQTAGVKRPAAAGAPAAEAGATPSSAKKSATETKGVAKKNGTGKPGDSATVKGGAAKPAPAPKPAEADAGDDAGDEPEEKAAPAKKGAIGSRKGIATPSSKKGLQTPSGKKRGAAPPPAPADGNKTMLLAAGGLVIVGILVAILIVVASSGDKPQQTADANGQPNATASGNPSGGTPGHTPVNVGNGSKGGEGADTPTDAPVADNTPLTPAEQEERDNLNTEAGEIIGFAKTPDEFAHMKALKRLDALDKEISPKNKGILRKTRQKVKEILDTYAKSAARDQREGEKHAAEEKAKKKAEDERRAAEEKRRQEEEAAKAAANNPSGPAPEPTPPPNPSLLAYQELQKKLNPAMAAFDFDGAKKMMGDCDGLEGQPAKDLEDDKAAVDVLQKLIDYAGMEKAWKDIKGLEDQVFILTKGDKVVGTLQKVEKNTLTIFMKIGGLADYKISELALKDVCAYARKGCPKEEKQNAYVGWGLAVYYTGDLDVAKSKLEDGLKEPGTTAEIAKHFLARIIREKIAGGSKSSDSPPPGKPDKKNPGKETAGTPAPPPDAPSTPDTPADPSAPAATGMSAAQLAQIKESVHGGSVMPSTGGAVDIHYDCVGSTADAVAEDFTSKGFTEIGRQENWTLWGLIFALGSQDQGAAQHNIIWKGDFDWKIEFLCNVSISDPTALMFLCDVSEAKKTKAIGSYFGMTYEKIDGKKTHVSGNFDSTKFGGEKRNTIRFLRKGDLITVFFGGSKVGETKFTTADARFALQAVGYPIFLESMDFHGVVNMDKLKK